MILVEDPGPLSLFQDLGRAGQSAYGVSPSGAADRAAHALANRLVGNPPGAATVESLLGGLTIRTSTLIWVAVTGAPTTGGYAPRALQPGERLRLGTPPSGLRTYLAVRGGFAVPPVLGSRSYDTLSGLGPPPLRAGDELPVGESPKRWPSVDQAPFHPPPAALTALPGPRRDWFTDGAWTRLLRTRWTVSADSDRVALRLRGAELPRRITGELPSEGLVRGAVQVPAAGQPLIFLADHPITGGYPVIAVLSDAAADHAAQLRPGDEMTFSAARP